MGLSVGTRPVPAAVARGAALAMERLEDLTDAAKRVSHAIRSKRPARTVAAEAIEHVAAVAAAGGDPNYLRPPSLDLAWPLRRAWDVGASVVGAVAGLALLASRAFAGRARGARRAARSRSKEE